jgi:hypothetical protein
MEQKFSSPPFLLKDASLVVVADGDFLLPVVLRVLPGVIHLP